MIYKKLANFYHLFVTDPAKLLLSCD